MAKDLILEIGTEEIPARFMDAALEQINSHSRLLFKEHRLDYKTIETFGTPRRLVLVIRDLIEHQADKQTENRGPSVKAAFDANGVPTRAAQGFARGQGIDVTQLMVKDGYVYASRQEVGRPADKLLPEILPELIRGLNFPKNMRWGDLDIRFVRPIRWLMALYGGKIIPFTVAGVTSGDVTYGHRFLSSGVLKVASVDDYFQKTRENFVIVDQEERRALIKSQVEKIAAAQGGIAGLDEELLTEVTYLVEYPTALAGKFEEKYLELPAELVITPMREHQRYFPVVSATGKLMPVFITVRNGNDEYIDTVRYGNERVLRARLADAGFFFAEDRKVPLVDRVKDLKTVVFQEGLGTMYDKTQRIEKLAGAIADEIGVGDASRAVIQRASYLAKADLVTAAVYEFTELQGTMGREYAKLSGEEAPVAEAIFEHYLPRFAGDILPASRPGKVISIADKLDNIVATFSRGLIPTGSQDPYALRRQALGIVNIIIEAKWQLSLDKLLRRTMELLAIDSLSHPKLAAEVKEFFNLRLRNVLNDENIRYDIIDAVMAGETDDIYDTWLRAGALATCCNGEMMQKAVQAFTRAGNLAGKAGDCPVDPDLFTGDNDAEEKLYVAYTAAHQQVAKLVKEKDYGGVLQTIAGMAGPIAEFFANVMVMVDDEQVRSNRLALLKAITELAGKVADFSKIVEPNG